MVSIRLNDAESIERAGARNPAENGVRALQAVLWSLGSVSAKAVKKTGFAWGVSAEDLQIKQVPLTLPNLPAQFEGYRIAQMSDMHAGDHMNSEGLARVVDITNALRPDLVAVTGDFVSRVYPGVVEDLVPVLANLRATDGVFATLGNHDYWGKPGHEVIREVIGAAGMVDLNNRVHSLERDGAVFHVAGVDSDRMNRARLDVVLDALPREGAAMLLAHEPDFADRSAPTNRFDLQISGHSHGGQIVLPFVGPPALPPGGRKYHTGLYRVGNMIQYTNRGVGSTGLHIRINCPPELTVFTLHSPQA